MIVFFAVLGNADEWAEIEAAEEFERAVRRHWGVENKLHWQLDFTFRGDKNTTSMAKAGAKNLQIMKKIVLSILL